MKKTLAIATVFFWFAYILIFGSGVTFAEDQTAHSTAKSSEEKVAPDTSKSEEAVDSESDYDWDMASEEGEEGLGTGEEADTMEGESAENPELPAEHAEAPAKKAVS